jgi:hypothetical protein
LSEIGHRAAVQNRLAGGIQDIHPLNARRIVPIDGI